jgi:hypothetical protein
MFTAIKRFFSRVESNQCNCVFLAYKKAVDSGKLSWNSEVFQEIEYINRGYFSSAKNYLCKCQPERSKREDVIKKEACGNCTACRWYPCIGNNDAVL